MEDNRGLKRFLQFKFGYRAFQSLVGSERASAEIVTRYIGPTEELDVLDIGAGDSDILRLISPKSYTAIEPNENYIRAASKNFPGRITSIPHGIGHPNLDELSITVDLVLLLGVIHHLDANYADQCIQLASRALRERNGKLVMIEPVLVERQNPIARTIIKNDRGQNVRDSDGYLSLLKRYFGDVQHEVRHDLLRIPYSHFVAIASPA